MTTATAAPPRADELRGQITEAEQKLAAIAPSAATKNEVDALHNELRSLHAALREEGPVTTLPAGTLSHADALEIERERLQTEYAQIDASPANMGEIKLLAEKLADAARLAETAWAHEVAAGGALSSPELAELLAARREVDESDLSILQKATRNGDLGKQISAVRKRQRAEALAAKAAEKKQAETDARNTPTGILAAEIAALEAKRSRLALRALDGDADARTELDAAEVRIAEAHREIELHKLAAAEKERLRIEAEREAAAEAKRAEEARIEFLLAERETRMAGVLHALAALRDRVRDLLPVDRELSTSSKAGQGYDGHIVDLTQIALLDAGIRRSALEDVPYNAHAAKLLAQWPIPATVAVAESETSKVGRPCGVCEYDRVDEVERALLSGTPITEIVAAHQGLSRHAIGRHRDHVRDAA
jgi:hypothetical protein